MRRNGGGGRRIGRAKNFAARVAAFAFLMAALMQITAYADTNGGEIQIADQPDRLILQLGPEWAGAEFELKTDAGVFPAPVVVDPAGILKMDLGGSKTYTLRCIASPAAVPGAQAEPDAAAPTPPPPPQAQDSAAPAPAGEAGIPAAHLAMFLGGIAAAAGGLAAMRRLRRRREAYDYDGDDEDYE